MKKKAANMSTAEYISFFMRFTLWILSVYTGVVDWFSISKENFPADESGELIHRYMARKSWFDNTSSGWVEQPFLIKTAYIAGISLTSALFGLLVNASVLFGLSALFISLVVHSLLISHERNRLDGAIIFAKETLALNKQLNESQDFFKGATQTLHAATDELQGESTRMDEQADLLDLERNKVQQANDVLITVIEDTTRETGRLLSQEREVSENFTSITVDLEKCGQAISHTTENVEKLGDALSQFSATTQSMQQSQKTFSHTVDHFCLFVNRLPHTNTADVGDETDEFIESIKRQNDEDEALIDEMKLMMAN